MRIEQINTAAEERYPTSSLSSTSRLVDAVLFDLRNAFVEGALWSDNNPDVQILHPSTQPTEWNYDEG